MAEEFGGVHMTERRSGVDRRASNWRDATDRQHEARRRQYVALVTALDALVAKMRDHPHIYGPMADRLATILATYRES